MPSEARIKDLRADYRAMAPMMFDEKPPAFDEILAQIRDLQDALKTYKTLSISNLRHLAGRNLHRLLQSAAGHEAVIKVEAFPFTRYGILHGTVIRVATDATPEPDARQLEEMSSGNLQSSVPVSNAQRVQNLVYPVVIKPLETDILVSGRAVPLAPGMTVTIEIKTGQRRILEYLFSPLAEVASGAMKER